MRSTNRQSNIRIAFSPSSAEGPKEDSEGIRKGLVRFLNIMEELCNEYLQEVSINKHN